MQTLLQSSKNGVWINVHQNNVARTSTLQHRLDDYRNQLFRLRYSIPPQPIDAVHCVLENIQQRPDNGAEKCYFTRKWKNIK